MGKKKGDGKQSRRINEEMQRREAKERRASALHREHVARAKQYQESHFTHAVIPVVVVFVVVASMLGTLAQWSFLAASVVTSLVVAWLTVGVLGWNECRHDADSEETNFPWIRGVALVVVASACAIALRVGAKLIQESFRRWLPPLVFTLLYVPWSLVELGMWQ